MRVLSIIAISTLLLACQQDGAATGSAVHSGAVTESSGSASQAHDDDRKSNMTALETLLHQFSVSTTWGDFDRLDHVQWLEPSPMPAEDTRGYTHERSGKLLLIGFGETDLPNGKLGVDFDYVRGNEGESGFTLTGSELVVDQIAITKFYPGRDYAKVISQQFEGGIELVPLTSACPRLEGGGVAEANTRHNQFFRLTLPDGGTLYAEGFVEEDGGKYSPGSTIYQFYREKPEKRMQSMDCQEAGGR